MLSQFARKSSRKTAIKISGKVVIRTPAKRSKVTFLHYKEPKKKPRRPNIALYKKKWGSKLIIRMVIRIYILTSNSSSSS
jgi:hypothetical protein